MQDRIQRLRSELAKSGLDGMLLTSLVNMRYLSGFTSVDATVLITAGSAILFTDFRYTIQAREQTRGLYDVREFARGKLYEDIEKALAENTVRRCGFEQEDMTVARFERFRQMPVTFVPFGTETSKLRMVKSADEIDSMAKAQAIADAAYTQFLDTVRPGMTEREAAAELLYICGKLGSEGPSFDPIIGSGPNGAMCHAVPGERKLQSGDLVVTDFGCKVDGYCSDMTRTFGIGKLDPELVKIYGIVLEAQLRTLDALKPGITGKQLDATARDFIASKGYGDCFGHGLGHGFGLNIHESPTGNAASDEVLRPGMTMTVEPGIYIEGLGGVRIEDCCVVTENGHQDFVISPKGLTIL